MKAKLPAFPYLIWMALFILIPLGLVAYFAFTTGDGTFTMENIFQVGNYTTVLMKSLWLALISTVICLIIAYPLSYSISKLRGASQRTVLLLVMLPMWMNFLLRTYAWMTLLENNGLINKLLNLIGLPSVQMINTPGAVVLGMVYNYLPFMIMPLYSVMTKLDPSVIEAAQDLGASPSRVFFRVLIPLTIPGITTGVTMVFVPAVSTFIISRMLGGGGNLLIGDLIDLQFVGNSYNANLGSAISLVLMVVILLCMSVMNQFDSDDSRGDMLI